MTETMPLLLEIGCEEIPARFLEAAQHELGVRLGAALSEARLLDDLNSIKTASTPRRLVVYAARLASRQPDRAYTVSGPPVKAAYDSAGRPTRAAEAFAAKHKLPVESLRRIHNEKGEYVAAEVHETGREAIKVLHEILPKVLAGVSFPKSMYWTAKAGPFFVRPIRWILALLWRDGHPQLVPFEFAGVQSGSFTFGHRLEGSQPLEVSDPNHDQVLEKHMVVLHRAERRQRVADGIKALLEGKDLVTVKDESLQDWVVNSTEWPAPLMGGFDGRYLALPREVLVTVMRDHQKYFALEDETGNLKPHFITVLNVPGDPKGFIRQGHERVLAARFADAEFFWNADQKITMAKRIPMLERVTYQTKLGTYADKVRRMKSIAGNVCVSLENVGQMNPTQRARVLRAVDLCKCDLTTQMVQEFTELQGIMGGIYAKSQGEPEEVADAIYDHYRPAGIEDSCPRSIVGAIVSLADKLDSVVAGFAAGLEPTGSSDPFGLRRAGNGIIKLLVGPLAGLNLTSYAVEHTKQVVQGTHDALLGKKVDAFLLERLESYLRETAGLRYDTVLGVLSPNVILEASYLIPSTALARAKALERTRDTEDFQALAAAAKRTRNILYKSAKAQDYQGGSLDPMKLKEPAERELHAAYQSLNEQLASLGHAGHYEEAFRVMASIRPQVDRFFDNVLVMAEDPKVRTNRLHLLIRLNQDVFTRLADISEIVVAGAEGPARSA